jgi:pSer/pThr/pTyr-binding forkhead associated (FHA) protein
VSALRGGRRETCVDVGEPLPGNPVVAAPGASYTALEINVPPPNAGPERSSTHSSSELLRIFLRFGDHDVEVVAGETVLGRGPKSTVVLDDALVSRTHAKIVVERGVVTLEDLGSANGVLVNGERLDGKRTLVSGDRVVLGQQSFMVLIQAGPMRSEPRSLARTLTGARDSNPAEPDRIGPTRRGDALELLCGVAEKVLALGRGDEAERILSSYFRNMLQTARSRGELDPVAAEKAVTYAVRIAEVTGKGAWIDYAFDMYAVPRRPLPVAVVERLYEVVRKVTPVSGNAFRQYLLALRSAEPEMGVAERFLIRRIEGLESLVSPR